MPTNDESRTWIDQQLPGLVDEPLWTDYGLVISVPQEFRPGFTNKVNVRRIDHANYLEWNRRTLLLDQTTGLDLSVLPAALDVALAEFGSVVYTHLHPFI